MRTENNLFLVRVSIDLALVRVVEIDQVFYAGPKSLGFSVSIEFDFVFAWMVEIDLIFCGGSNLT